MLKYLKIIGVAGLAVAIMAGCSKSSTHQKKGGYKNKEAAKLQGPRYIGNSTLFDIVAHKNKLSQYAMAIRFSGTSQMLRSKQYYTIFAPTNDAFNKLPYQKFNQLMKPSGRQELVKIMRYHMVKGVVLKSQLTAGRTLTSTEGATLTVSRKNGRIYINGGELEKATKKVSNGIIYFIDKVLIPPH
jgi:uncharacterized surface protein with fasciclin (FAS1) repeats